MNTTDPSAVHIHGTDPQFLIEKILRMKIYDSQYYKEHCFALTAETMVDKAVDLQYVGGSFGGNRKPTQFMCLMLKMLMIQPEKDIVVEFILNEDYKYVRLLGAFYLRLTGRPMEVYQYLEPLLNDYRKIRYKNNDGKVVIRHMDEIVDDMLTKGSLMDITLPRLPKRDILEETHGLAPRASGLEGLDEEHQLLLEEHAAKEEKQKEKQKEKEEQKTSSKSEKSDKSDKDAERRKRSRSRSATRSRRDRSRSRSRSRSRGARDSRRDRERDRSHSRGRDRDSRRERDRARDRRRDRSRSRSRGRR